MTVTPVLAVTQADIDALTKEASGLKQQKAELREKINALSGDLSTAVEEKTLLDGEIEVIGNEVSNLEAQIDTYNGLIAQTQAELEDAQRQEEDQYALFCERVRSMEEKGRLDYLSVLFRASSFTDLLTRLDFVSEIMEADQRVIDDLRNLQVEISDKQTELEGQRASVEDARLELLDKQAELDTQREAANQLIIQLQAMKSDVQGDLDDLSDEEDAIQSEILRLSKQMAKEEAERRAKEAAKYSGELTSPVALGGYNWPVDSRRINSTFGGRSSPGGIGSTNHKGVDIGGVGYGTTVRAAKAGKVIISQYSSSYGNYVVISHGSGNTTLYAHMSKRSVSVGQYVSQGQAIGTTGSTGRSTGPHLHFEITENGSRINPLRYLNNYYLSR